MRFSIHMDLGPNIRMRREALAISQSELALSCGLKPAVISHYEAGNRSPSLEAIIRLASRLRCTVSDLLGQTNAPAPVVCPTCNGTGVVLSGSTQGTQTESESADHLRAQVATLTRLLKDCWDQFSIEVTADGEQWQSDGALSTLEDVADYLVEIGYLEKHPSRPIYRRKP